MRAPNERVRPRVVIEAVEPEIDTGRFPVKRELDWQLLEDPRHYGGSGQGNLGGVQAGPEPWHGRPFSVELTLPPLALVCLRGTAGPPETGRS